VIGTLIVIDLMLMAFCLVLIKLRQAGSAPVTATGVRGGSGSVQLRRVAFRPRHPHVRGATPHHPGITRRAHLCLRSRHGPTDRGGTPLSEMIQVARNHSVQVIA
jgi:hypothetical protein